MNEDCIFCKIIQGEIPGDIVYKDDWVTAFRDINPAAPTHVLIIPNKHIPSVNEIKAEDQLVAGRMLRAAREVAISEKVDQTGYRLIINNGPDANQEVFHIHLHLIGGQKMKYPMG